MLRKIETPLGNFIMLFGGVESGIRASIIGILQYSVKTDSEKKFINYIRSVIITNDSLNANLDVLSKTVDFFVEDSCKTNWKRMITKTKEILVFRNVVVHGIWGVNENNEIIKPKKTYEESIISEERISKAISEVTIIYKQLMDFMEFEALTNSNSRQYSDYRNVKDKLRLNK
jgi:hypothetical protein